MARKPRAEIEITAENKTKAGFSSATKSLKAFSSKVGAMASTAAGAVAAIGVAVGFVGKKMFDTASGAVEIRNRYEQVFGAATEAVSAFGEEFRNINALTRIETEDMLANIGAITKGMGFAQDEVVDLTKEIANLGADLGSFKDIEADRAVEALTKAILGETESLKMLGIPLIDVQVKQRALAETGKTTTSALTQQEIAVARLHEAYAIAGRSGIVGDAVKTQDAMARNARRLRADIKTLWEEISMALIPVFEALLPVMSDVTKWLIDDFLPAAKEAIGWMTDHLGITVESIRKLREEIKGLSAEEITIKMHDVNAKLREASAVMAEMKADSVSLSEQMADSKGFEKDAFLQLLTRRNKEIREQQDLIWEIQGQLAEFGRQLEQTKTPTVPALGDSSVTTDVTVTGPSTEEAEKLNKEIREKLGDFEIPMLFTAAEGGAALMKEYARAVAEEAGWEVSEDGQITLPIKLSLDQVEGTGIDPAAMAQTMSDFSLAFETTLRDRITDFEYLTEAALELDMALGNMAANTLVNFADGWVESFEAIGAGEPVFDSIATAAKRAVADAATVEAKNQAAMGIAKLAMGIWPPNPAALASAAQHFAAAAAFGALAGFAGGVRQAAPGGDVGSRPPISDDSIGEVRDANSRAGTTINIEGGLLDMSDPRQAQALKEAFEDASGRNVVITGG